MHTNNKTAIYLNRKNELEASIGWYIKTIDQIEEQQLKRKQVLDELRNELYTLEKDYNGT